LNPELLLPSHGPQIKEPLADLQRLRSRILAFQNRFNIQRAGRWNWSGFVQVSEHVIQDCGSTSQLVISASGDALLFDCGGNFTPERLAEPNINSGSKRSMLSYPAIGIMIILTASRPWQQQKEQKFGYGRD